MSSHRKPGSARTPFSQTAIRFGLLAAGIATAATAAPGTASAAGIGIVADSTFTHANRVHQVDAEDSFTVRQLGTKTATAVRNQANAVGAGCSVDDACRSVALSFQIVTVAGEQTRLNAVNLSDARNQNCDGCQTLAGAYQFVVNTPTPFRFGAATQNQLAGLHHRLDALTRSGLPATELRQQADALAAEVSAVLKTAVANAQADPGQAPDVTMHRHLDGWPSGK